MATIKDVAQLAGVSTATVSRVFSGKPPVSQETQAKVRQAARQLGYEPNLLGSALRMARTHKLLAVAPSLEDPFCERAAQGIQWKAASLGYDVLFGITHHSPALEQKCIDQLRSRLWDGAVFLSFEGEPSSLVRLAREFPVVQCLTYLEGLDIPVAAPDYALAAAHAVETLCGLGHRRVALLSEGGPGPEALKRHGYRQALEQAGILPDPALSVEGAVDYDSARRITRELLHLSFPPTAILCGSDVTALAALEQAREMGLAADVSICGFGGTELCLHSDPPLSTVSLPLERAGQIAAELLCRRIEGGLLKRRQVLLGHELILRDSVHKK